MQLMERDAKTVPRGVMSARQLQGRRCSFMSHWEQCSAQYALLPDDETLSSPNPWVIRIGWSMTDPKTYCCLSLSGYKAAGHLLQWTSHKSFLLHFTNFPSLPPFGVAGGFVAFH